MDCDIGLSLISSVFRKSRRPRKQIVALKPSHSNRWCMPLNDEAPDTEGSLGLYCNVRRQPGDKQ